MNISFEVWLWVIGSAAEFLHEQLDREINQRPFDDLINVDISKLHENLKVYVGNRWEIHFIECNVMSDVCLDLESITISID